MYFDEKSTPYITADTHYFHSNVIDYCKRPFPNEKEMRLSMIESYNSLVGRDSDCFFAGDFAMIGPSQHEKLAGLLKKLNGRKHLILGNHDEIKPFTYVNCGFTSVHTSMFVDVKMAGSVRKFVLNHDPCVWDIIPEDVILMCGHIHNLFKIIPDKNVINVGVDVWGFKPITFKKAWDALLRRQVSKDIANRMLERANGIHPKRINTRNDGTTCGILEEMGVVAPERDEVIRPNQETG